MNIRFRITKRLYLCTICAILFAYSNVAAQQQNEYAHWSLKIEAGTNRTQSTNAILGTEGYGYILGAELERTFNPLWGLVLDYAYINYSVSNQTGVTHEIAGLLNVNLANLLHQHRPGNWQKLNVYGHLGAGLSHYNANTTKNTTVIPIGASIEYNITPRLAININGDRRWHTSTDMGLRTLQERAVIWTATVGLRIKFGKKTHIRNTRLQNYEAPYATDRYNTPELKEQVAQQENTIHQLQDELNQVKIRLVQVEEQAKKVGEELQKSKETNLPSTNNQPLIIDDDTFKLFQNIDFKLNSVELTVAAKQQLDQLAKRLKNQSNIKLEISGYTDTTGTKAFNHALSQQRANSVKDYLVRAGIDDSRLIIIGYGDSHPIAPNDTYDGRRLNRRAEIKVVN
jgi:OOP family OmpA-OmpF porin